MCTESRRRAFRTRKEEAEHGRGGGKRVRSLQSPCLCHTPAAGPPLLCDLGQVTWLFRASVSTPSREPCGKYMH